MSDFSSHITDPSPAVLCRLTRLSVCSRDVLLSSRAVPAIWILLPRLSLCQGSRQPSPLQAQGECHFNICKNINIICIYIWNLLLITFSPCILFFFSSRRWNPPALPCLAMTSAPWVTSVPVALGTPCRVPRAPCPVPWGWGQRSSASSVPLAGSVVAQGWLSWPRPRRVTQGEWHWQPSSAEMGQLRGVFKRFCSDLICWNF